MHNSCPEGTVNPFGGQVPPAWCETLDLFEEELLKLRCTYFHKDKI